MDLNDLWQEHKRWILGVAAGLVVFWIGTKLIGAFYPADSAVRSVAMVTNSLRTTEVYGVSDRKQAQADLEKAEVAEARLRAAVAFQPSDEFRLAGHGDPDIHYSDVSRRVRTSLLDRAQEFGVDLTDKGLSWDTTMDSRADLAATLMGIGVLEQGVLRLLDAGDAIRAQDPEALGLVRVEKFEVSKKQAKRTRRGGRRNRGVKETVDINDRIEEYAVSFKFTSDMATLRLFLEKCRGVSPILSLQPGLNVKPGPQLGDPLVVTGSLAGITIKETTP